MHIKENIKAPRHWPLCGEFTGTVEFPAQRASYAESVSIWWRHHDLIVNLQGAEAGLFQENQVITIAADALDHPHITMLAAAMVLPMYVKHVLAFHEEGLQL